MCLLSFDCCFGSGCIVVAVVVAVAVVTAESVGAGWDRIGVVVVIKVVVSVFF